jgi:hypothetical protein
MDEEPAEPNVETRRRIHMDDLPEIALQAVHAALDLIRWDQELSDFGT